MQRSDLGHPRAVSKSHIEMSLDSDDECSRIRHIILSMLQKQKLGARALTLDQSFVRRCLEEAASLGCPMEAVGDHPSFHKSTTIGAAIAFFAYNYIKDEDVKVYIGTYTSIIIYIEDTFGDKPEVVYDFNARFTSGQSQSAVLSAQVDANFQADGHALFSCRCRFPAYVRNMSGNGEPYVMFMFPRDMDFKVYAQAIPTLALAIDYLNDVMSFYKEELAGETNNYVSLMAKHCGAAKLDILQRVADQVVSWLSTAETLLSTSQPAREALRHFSQGYVDYHTSASRYQLRELMGDEFVIN
ncbi:trichodiene synthase family protein [Pleurotus pulmonarius]